MFLKISKYMGPAENILEKMEYFVYNTVYAQYFSYKILGLIFSILNNGFLSAMIIFLK